MSGQLLITIEGTIGAGKSTVLRALREDYAADEEVMFVDEPVDQWIAGGDGRINLLDSMYRGSLAQPTFQLMALATRIGPVVKALRSASVVICERSIWSDKHVFAELGLRDPVTRAAYELSHAALHQSFPAGLKEVLVLLDVPVTVAIERIVHRGRPEEQGVDAAYLRQLEAGHARLEASCRCEGSQRVLMRIDAKGSTDAVVAEVRRRVADAIETHRIANGEPAAASPLASSDAPAADP